MNQTVKFDFSETRVLVDALTTATRVLPKDAAAVVARGAYNIKKDAARRVTGLKHAPAYPRSITYDTYVSLTGPSAEIGPDKSRRQGALGNLIEYGSVNNAPIPHMLPAGEAEAPRFEKAMEDLAVRALGPVFT